MPSNLPCVCYGLDGEKHRQGDPGCIWHDIPPYLWHKSHVGALQALQDEGIMTTQSIKEETTMVANNTKVSSKLTRVNENFSVNMYDNGFMFEIGGRDKDDEWKNAKIMVQSVDELVALIKEATDMERD